MKHRSDEHRSHASAQWSFGHRLCANIFPWSGRNLSIFISVRYLHLKIRRFIGKRRSFLCFVYWDSGFTLLLYFSCILALFYFLPKIIQPCVLPCLIFIGIWDVNPLVITGPGRVCYKMARKFNLLMCDFFFSIFEKKRHRTRQCLRKICLGTTWRIVWASENQEATK